MPRPGRDVRKFFPGVEEYSKYLNYAVYAAIAATVAWLSVRAYRRQRERVGQNGR
ncbi:hypothetical protein [Arthrobacter sp. Y81]|uniref:hypothetical protein n=1 Tax=Arthrobacter sp. Y81 TaxID=2058897 RepID=UPI0015E38BF7|nr:hypothetical protein [Arthrobacter sp. Y81]